MKTSLWPGHNSMKLLHYILFIGLLASHTFFSQDDDIIKSALEALPEQEASISVDSEPQPYNNREKLTEGNLNIVIVKHCVCVCVYIYMQHASPTQSI